MDSADTFELASTFVVLSPNHAAFPVAVTPTLYQELDRRFANFTDHLLVSVFSFETDWSSWEIHPAGDEIVCLLSGEATMIFEQQGGEKAVSLREPGSFVIVPKGTWHTARTSVPTTMLFVTPGEGTQNRSI